MVRAGSNGEREDKALDGGRLLPGFRQFEEDLSDFKSRKELLEYLRERYGASKSNHTLGSWVGQMWRFAHDMGEGDYVAMPMKNVAGTIAIGQIDGAYLFDSQAPVGCRHIRPVKWSGVTVERDALGPDLRASLGAFPRFANWRNMIFHHG